MNKFSADFSSSIDSPLGKEDARPQRSHLASSSFPELASTTPIAPPPSQIFGSSTFGSGVSKLQFAKPAKSSPPLRPAQSPQYKASEPRTKNGTPVKWPAPSLPPVTKPRPYHTSFGTTIGSEVPDDEGVGDAEDDGDQEMEAEYRERHTIQSRQQSFAASLMTFSPDQSRMSTRRRCVHDIRLSALPNKGNRALIPSLARDMAERGKPPPLDEPDGLILATERLLRRLDDDVQQSRDLSTVPELVTRCIYQLLPTWRQFSDPEPPSLKSNDIGPPPSAPAVVKAEYLASLYLALRVEAPTVDARTMPTPQILLDWLENYHVSYDPLYRTVASASPNCAAHDLFWDAIQSLALRGKLQSVMQLFADADFRYAASAVDDGMEGKGYKGTQLQAIQAVIYQARVLLNQCPAVQTGDWDVAGDDWDMFRTQVESEMDKLTELASTTNEDDAPAFEAENFGLRKPAMKLLGKLGQKSTSIIPWTIFQNLKILYSILLGSAAEIAAQSQDWLEAATALTIWWDGTSDASVARWSFDVSRATNLTDDTGDINPYLARLRDSFLSVTDPTDKNSFQINAISPVEVGLGAVLQGSTHGTLVVLSALSQCVAAAVAEMAAKAGWLEGESQAKAAGLNDDDLMVLNYGSSPDAVSKDEILLHYAESLFETASLKDPATGSTVEGWELALAVVTRFDNHAEIHAVADVLLQQVSVVTRDRAEKLTNLCAELGLQEEARHVSGRYGDYLANNTSEYGTALLCYARSHSIHQIRQLLDLLISYSIVQSRAFPPDQDMDEGLQSLVGNPRAALADIAEHDPEAAEMLQFYLVGYACLRRFYTLRDAGTPTGPSRRPRARRRAAAKALIAAIDSAADSIYGGLYDPNRQTAIQVDGLLALLGEATALITPESVSTTSAAPSVFTAAQIYALLAALEDLSTVSSRVYDAVEDCLQASLRHFHGSPPPSPHALLKKSLSAGSGSNSHFSFSMMGSEMLGKSDLTSTGGGDVKSVGSSGVLIKDPKDDRTPVIRGWDWRERFPGKNVTGKDIVQFLRLGLVKELSLVQLDA